MPSSSLRLTQEEDTEDGVRSLQANSDDSDDSSERYNGTSRSRKIAAGAGISLLIAAVIGTVYYMNSPTSEEIRSVHHLMHSDQFHHAVRERVLLSASQNGQNNLEVDAVDKEIEDGLAKAFSKLERTFPDVSKKLKSGVISEEQERALLTMIGSVHDKRLKDVGSKAIGIVLKNAIYGPKEIKKQLQQEFQPDMPRLVQLHEEIVPESIREATAQWYERMREKSAVDKSATKELDDSWSVLLHPKSIAIMQGFWSTNKTSETTALTQSRRLFEGSPAAKIGVGISGIVLDALNIAVINLSYLLQFKMPWWGWMLTLLPGVSLGLTSCAIAPIEKSYSDYWCVDFLSFTGIEALTVLVNNPSPSSVP